MKTSIRIASIAILFLAIAFSCSKDKTVTPLSQSNGVLLAGASGQSKTWKIASIIETDNVSGQSPVTYSASVSNGDIPSCEADNIFTFSNNSTQDYSLVEGRVTCNISADSVITSGTTIEKGSWAFTNDGKSLLVDGAIYINNAQFYGSYFLSYFLLTYTGTPLTVTTITSTNLTLTYTEAYTKNGVPATADITLTFTSGN